MIQKFKKFIGDLFADRAGKWSKVDDYLITGMILISTIEIVVSTFHGLPPAIIKALSIVNFVTVVFFTIEVTLRIWTIADVEPKYAGKGGRLKYCLSFWGLIDILATYPYYLSLFLPIPVALLNSLKVLRIFRIFRFTPSFKIVVEAFRSKKNEISISLQLLVIITILLSLVMYYVESAAQPDQCHDGLIPILWSFMQYIGDPGGFADFTPITLIGKVMASFVGILGIAIFAVPAGLLGSAFVEVLDEENKNKANIANASILKKSFKRIKCRNTGHYIAPRYVSLVDIMAKYGLSENDIIDATNASTEFRLRNLATAQPVSLRPLDKLVVEHFPINTNYGCCIDRGSKVTIVSTSCSSEAAIGSFSYYVAKMGGFNYISKELELDGSLSYYNINSSVESKIRDNFLGDIKRLSSGENTWTIALLSSGGGQEPIYPTDFHFVYGAKKGDDGYLDPDLTIENCDDFESFYSDFEKELEEKYNIKSDKHKYFGGKGERNIARHIRKEVPTNFFTLRIAWAVTCWSYDHTAIAEILAKKIRLHLSKEDDAIRSSKEIEEVGNGYIIND